MKYLLFLLTFLIPILANAQKDKKDVNKGNKEYETGNFSEAELSYRRGIEKNGESVKAYYNLGNTMYKQNKLDESREIYSNTANLSNDKNIQANSLYNIGNSFLNEKKWKESIDAYKQALKLNPTDMEAKSNLAYAQKMLEKQSQDQDGDGGGEDNKDSNQDQDQDKDGDGDNDDKDKGDKDDQNQGDQESDGNNDPNQNPQGQGGDKPTGQQPDQSKISPQAAQQILDAMQNNEQKTQEKVQKAKEKKTQTNQVEKYW